MNTITGIKWPLSLSGGRVVTSSGNDHLSESIVQIVLCEKGEYIMRPTFGSGLPTRVFDPVSLLALIHTDVADALRTWERRVDLVKVRVGPIESTGTFMLGAATTDSVASGVVGVHIAFRPKGQDEIVDLELAMNQR